MESHGLKIRNITIGTGKPKICIPVTGSTEEEICEQMTVLSGLCGDMIEWRMDWFQDVDHLESVKRVLGCLRTLAGDMPILITFRTKSEGGERELTVREYERLNREILRTGMADLIDIELSVGEEILACVMEEARRANTKVIVSHHDFFKTPKKEEILFSLREMQRLGADICKIAVTPSCMEDVFTLLSAVDEVRQEYASCLVVAIAMGEKGLVTRICGELFGSVMTFASAGRPSAPGQIPVDEMGQLLEMIHTHKMSGK